MLPIGVFSVKQHNNTNRVSLIMLVINIIVLASNFYFKYIDMMILVMICVTLTFVVVGIYANANNVLNPIINEMNNTCNYKDFDLKLQEIEEVENLHSDSKAYLNLLRCNYLEYISPKKTTELFMSIKKPTSAFYKRCYDELEILNYIRSGDYDKAKELYIEILEQDPTHEEAKNALADLASSDYY